MSERDARSLKAEIFQGLSIGYGLLRFAAGLRGFVREPITLEAASRITAQRMADRSGRFLSLVERAVFANPGSPYLQLFRAAGCEPGDLAGLVQADGVEGALEQLRQAGVYVGFEEFKGRAEAIRGSQRFSFRDVDFDNPLISSHFQISSGGTGGRPTRIMIDLEYLEQRAPHWALWLNDHDLLRGPLVFITAYYPGIVNRQLICAKVGQRFARWYTTSRAGSAPYRLVTGYVHGLARRVAGFPAHHYMPLSEPDRLAQELVGLAGRGARVCAITSPSTAIRISAAAQAGGACLERVTFILGGEPLTAARRTSIEASGARALPNYGSSEAGTIGGQCRHPIAPDEVHIAEDAFAVLQHRRPLPDGEAVDALLLTALLPASPKIMLNAEIGDYATIESRRCECVFDRFGFHRRLHTIRSFEKLTGEGVTFAGSDLDTLLEQVLPSQFGGTPADYQLVEQQDRQGLPRYELLISPEVGPLDEAAVLALFLRRLGQTRLQYRFMAEQWAQTGSLKLRRDRPVASPLGKVMPFRTLQAR